MQPGDALQTAKSMIQRHGMRAHAVAAERAAEMRLSGNTEGLATWEQICDLIKELRQSGRSAGAERSARI